MNRISQGRVSRAEPLDRKGEAISKRDWDWEGAPRDHRALFQDAVNYYLVCLPALITDKTLPAIRHNSLGRQGNTMFVVLSGHVPSTTLLPPLETEQQDLPVEAGVAKMGPKRIPKNSACIFVWDATRCVPCFSCHPQLKKLLNAGWVPNSNTVCSSEGFPNCSAFMARVRGTHWKFAACLPVFARCARNSAVRLVCGVCWSFLMTPGTHLLSSGPAAIPSPCGSPRRVALCSYEP